MIIRYTCKSCNREFSAHSAPDCPANWMAVLRPMLCCNRCYDYQTGLSSLRGAARTVAAAINHVRLSLKPESERSKEREEWARTQFVRITKAISKLVARHVAAIDPWEPDFAEMMMQKPDKTDRIIDLFVKGIVKR